MKKTYNVIWTEQMSICIKAENAKEAERMVMDCEYNLSPMPESEIVDAPQAYEVTI